MMPVRQEHAPQDAATAGAPEFDPTTVETFLELIRPDGGPVTLAAIVPDKGMLEARTFEVPDEVDEAINWAHMRNRICRNCYYTLNPPKNRRLTKKPTKQDIAASIGVWADIDPRGSDPLPAERQRLMALADELVELSLPPSFIVDSGSGLQPGWLLIAPIDTDLREWLTEVEMLCRRVEAALGAKGTFNPDRLLRLPGTINYADKGKLRAGRPERSQARLIHTSDRRYGWHDLEQLADRLEAAPPEHAVPVPLSKANGQDAAVDIGDEAPEPLSQERIGELCGAGPRFARAWAHTDDAPDQSLSGYDYRLCQLGSWHGLKERDLWALILAHRAHYGGAGKAVRLDYIEKTIDRALADVAEPEPARADPQPSPAPAPAPEPERDPYPVEALPQVIRDAALEYQAFGQQPIELVAGSALAAAATAGQALADVARGSALVGPCSLYFMTIAKSGERKTVADNEFSAEIRRWERDQAHDHKDQLDRAKNEHDQWTAKRDGLLARIKEATKKGRGTDVQGAEKALDELGSEPEVPPDPRLLLEDLTPEALARDMANGWPAAALWSAEAGTVLAGAGMSDETGPRYLALLNKLWGGEDFRVSRITRAAVRIEGRRLSAGLMCQPDVFGAFVSRADGAARGMGLLARFLIAEPASTMGTRRYRDPPEGGMPAVRRFNEQLRRLLDRPMPLDQEGRLDPPVLNLDPDAFDRWRAYHDAVEIELGGELADLADIAAKSAEQAARIAAVFHLFEHGGLGSGRISGTTMNCAVQIASWHLAEARRVLGLTGASEEERLALLLLEWLRRQKGQVAERDILRLGPYQVRRSAKVRDTALEWLVAAGEVRRLQDRGRAVVELVV